MRNVLVVLIALLLFSCEKEELPKPLTHTNSSEIKTLELGEDYRTQVGFSFQNNLEYKLDVMDWDFYIYPDKSIRLNTARFMKVASTNANFEWVDSNLVYDEFNASKPDYKLKCSEIESNWILDLGRDEEGTELMKYDIKVKFESDLFWLNYRIHGNESWTEISLKTTSPQGVFYSILNENQIQNPIFTQSEFYAGGYTTRFEEQNLDYLVRGILSNNSESVKLMVISDINFEVLKLKDIGSKVFSDKLDLIGFDWKNYDIEKGLYTVDSDRVFVVKYNNGLHYKFHFIGFYNDLGKKGFPKIEFSILE